MFQFIQGGIAKDQRGQIRFVNDFNMGEVKRFYLIKNSDLNLIRGWRAHRIEKRWFYILSGSFLINIVKIDNWESPSVNLKVEKILMNSIENKMIYLPPGYGTAIKALEPESEVLVFADHNLDHADLDNYTFELDYFKNI